MLDWQRDVLPVLRATYDLMDELQEDFLQGEDIVARLATKDRDQQALYRIFTQIKRGGYGDVEFAGAMSIAFVQPTEKGLQARAAGPCLGTAI